ncbi:oxysterol-binding protein-related protein 6 [Biomphalaria pfeifferi]|uniref:Oxysterol-binding protein-related protein 6 n=1 Tax=Biomphalaria pfeifferi TaxID=112525 RepID=A0AAD8AYB2_BIOPF|nr:oxysterol-binding protein-related protein 6 [Biomphalaria pfeifferi]
MNAVNKRMDSFLVQLVTKLEEVNEQVCTIVKPIGISTSLNNSDETFGAILNKTEEQIATISRCINNPLLNGDAVDGSAVYGCDSEPCKIGSHDKKPDICCDNPEHRSEHVNAIPACTQ